MPDLPDGHVDKIEIEVVRNDATQVNDIEQRHVRLDAEPAAGRPLRRGQGQVRGDPVPGRAADQQLLLLDEHERRPSTTSRCARRSTTRSTRRRWNGSTPAADGGHQILPPRHARPREVRALPARHGQSRSADQAEANPADSDITVWTDNESPTDEAGAYYQDMLEELGFNAKLKTINGDNYFTDDRQRVDARSRHRLAELVRRTTRTRTTTSSHCCAGESIPPTNNTNLAHFDDPGAEREDRQARRRAARLRAGSRIRRARQGIHGTGALGALRDQHVRDLRLQRIDLDKVVFNPTFGQDLASFAVEVAPGARLHNRRWPPSPTPRAALRRGPWRLGLAPPAPQPGRARFRRALRPDRRLRPGGAALGRPRRPHRAQHHPHPAESSKSTARSATSSIREGGRSGRSGSTPAAGSSSAPTAASAATRWCG